MIVGSIVQHVKVLTVVMPLKKKEPTVAHKWARELAPREMYLESEDQYLERKIIQARDKMISFHKTGIPSHKREPRKLISEMDTQEIVQLSPTKLMAEAQIGPWGKKDELETSSTNQTAKTETGPSKKEEEEEVELPDHELRKLHPEAVKLEVVKPEDFDMDEILKRAGFKSNVENPEETARVNQKMGDVEGGENEENSLENEKRHQNKS